MRTRPYKRGMPGLEFIAVVVGGSRDAAPLQPPLVTCPAHSTAVVTWGSRVAALLQYPPWGICPDTSSMLELYVRARARPCASEALSSLPGRRCVAQLTCV